MQRGWRITIMSPGPLLELHSTYCHAGLEIHQPQDRSRAPGRGRARVSSDVVTPIIALLICPLLATFLGRFGFYQVRKTLGVYSEGQRP